MNPIAEPVIEAHGLVKDFGRTRALDGLNLIVAPGEVHGFLGPNGAGKSTTLRILLGLIRTTAGTARVFGLDPWADPVAVHRDVAYVPGDVSLWPNLSGGEVIDLLTGLRGGADEKLRRDLIEEFEFDPQKKARTYSKGNRQKVALVAALAADAELLVLDEPTSGLDPLMEAVFQDAVREATSRGTSVLLSSHILAEVEALCDTVTIIRAGRAVQSGTLAGLRHLTRSRVSALVRAGDGAPDPVAALGGLAGVHALAATPEGGATRVTFHVDDDALPPVARALADLGPHGLVVEPPSLEELFLRQYGDELAALEGGGHVGTAADR